MPRGTSVDGALAALVLFVVSGLALVVAGAVWRMLMRGTELAFAGEEITAVTSGGAVSGVLDGLGAWLVGGASARPEA
jgi:hypothetical protein